MDIRRSLLLHAWAQTGIWLAIILVANHFSTAAPLRIDVTRDQRFTLSEVSRSTVSRLDKDLIIRVFYSDDLGPPYNNHKRALLDKLEELAAVSGGRVQVEVTNPDEVPGDADEATRYGIRPIPYRSKQGSRFEARDVFMGVAILYGDKVFPVDLLTQTETFEYQLIKGLRAVTRPPESRRVIAYSQGHGELDLMSFPEETPVAKLVSDLATTHDLRKVDLGTAEELSGDIDVLLIIGPERPLSARAQYQIDQHLMSGKPVAMFLRGMRPDFRSMKAQVVRHDLYALLGHYGVQLNKDVVIDREHNEQFEVPIVKNGRMRRVMVDYPLIPQTRSLNRAHPAMRGVDAAVLPFASSLTLPEQGHPGVQTDVLVSTEPESARIEGLIHIHPEVFQRAAPTEKVGSWPMVAALSGRFPSFYAEKEIPAPRGLDPNDPSWDPDPASKIVDSSPTRLLVAGSADMLANNPVLVANIIDWTVEDTELMDIRTERNQDSAFEPPTLGTLTTYRLATFGPLGLLYVIGLVILFVGRRRG